jgi:hypothetical protein
MLVYRHALIDSFRSLINCSTYIRVKLLRPCLHEGNGVPSARDKSFSYKCCKYFVKLDTRGT